MNRAERRRQAREDVTVVIDGKEFELDRSDPAMVMRVNVEALRWMYPNKVVLVYEKADDDGSDVLVLVFEDGHGQLAVELRPGMAFQVASELSDALKHLPTIRATYEKNQSA